MTRRSIVYEVLRENANRWVSGKTLVEAGAGWRYGARIYELRKAGHTIEERSDPERRSAVHQYRLMVEETTPGQAKMPWAEQ